MLSSTVGRDLSEQHASCGFDLQVAVGCDFSVESNRVLMLMLCGAAGGFGGLAGSGLGLGLGGAAAAKLQASRWWQQQQQAAAAGAGSSGRQQACGKNHPGGRGLLYLRYPYFYNRVELAPTVTSLYSAWLIWG